MKYAGCPARMALSAKATAKWVYNARWSQQNHICSVMDEAQRPEFPDLPFINCAANGHRFHGYAVN
jgi:hypothetical protein